MRHTDDSGKDSATVDLTDCATQAGLSGTGRREAMSVAVAIRALSVPITDVYASPYCRTVDTARLVFGRVSVSDVLIRPVGGATLASDDPRVGILKRTFAAGFTPGTNTAFVTHSEVIRATLGLDAAKGESFVLRPDGSGGYTVTARVLASGWKSP